MLRRMKPARTMLTKVMMMMMMMMMTKMTSSRSIQRKTSQAVLDEIGVTHPIMYDVYNLCDMAHNDKLSSFTVKMLKEICSHFELPFKARSIKADLIHTVNEMITECACASFLTEG